jgi:ribose transport system permease protein/inositol transport system permease protein
LPPFSASSFWSPSTAGNLSRRQQCARRYLVGLPTDRIIIGCYAVCSVIAAVAGLFLVGYVGQVDQWTGKGYELGLDRRRRHGRGAITGGRGNVFGALLGVLILVVMFKAR